MAAKHPFHGGFRGGKVIIIGPDGKPKEIELGDGKFDPANFFKGMPKEVQEAIKKSMKNGNFGFPSVSRMRNPVKTLQTSRSSKSSRSYRSRSTS